MNHETSWRNRHQIVAMHPDALQAIALKAAEARAVTDVLTAVVHGLTTQPDVALARIWLIAPGDICASCPMRVECRDQTRCLHLVASAGRPMHDAGDDWSRLDGTFRRFPLGIRKIGRIGATGAPILVRDIERDHGWIVRRNWAEREGIRAFAAQPLLFRGEVLGVLGVFHRAGITDAQFGWLRTFADQAAVAIANARAFEEIARLRDQLRLERDYLREEVKSARTLGEIVGRSPALQTVLQQVALVAPTEATVLILGESGTGKELIASAIHEQSARRDRPLVRVNCASVPRDLFESEFFGHARGAFTGAVRERVGRFQLADGGTLFLDEVGEIPLDLQSKLLRVLQQGQFEPVGDDRTRHVDVRVVAATNRDLKREVEAGRFREDLYYRLTVFPVTVPPLRARIDDVPVLASHFMGVACERLKRPRLALTSEAVRELCAYKWPGNVRELQNVIERAVIIARDGRLRFDLPQAPLAASDSAMSTPKVGEPVPIFEWRARERANIVAALERAAWKVYGRGGAAEMLGIKPTTLASRMKAMNIGRPR